jgi:hypothetical protein
MLMIMIKNSSFSSEIDIRTLETLYENMKKDLQALESVIANLKRPIADAPMDTTDWYNELEAYATEISKLDLSELRSIIDTPEDPPDWLFDEDTPEDTSDWYKELHAYAIEISKLRFIIDTPEDPPDWLVGDDKALIV